MMSEKRLFHHGDLRAALIDAALSAIQKDGIENLSLRELAKVIGVARSAPYRHFRTKSELVEAAAIASRKAAYDAYAAIPADLTPIERLKRACFIYLEYVRSNPNLVELSFKDHAVPAPAHRGESPLHLFIEMVRDAMPDSDDDQVNLTATACWSALLGFSVLKISGRTDRIELPEYAERALVDTILKMV